ncbi:MAG: hypothetical protein ACRD1J_01765 [Terriglobia bacterium]
MKALWQAVILLMVAAAPVQCLLAQQHASLSEAETEKLRDTQDPGKRIEVYLEFMQTRLTQFDSDRSQPPAPPDKTGKLLDPLLVQYVQLDDEMKDWIQYQYNRDADMRGGLRALLGSGSKQLEELRHAEQASGANSAPYANDLQNAIADLEDTLNGGTQALAQQNKRLGELKPGSKAAVQASATAVKKEKKRIKEDEKLRKKERKASGSENN